MTDKISAEILSNRIKRRLKDERIKLKKAVDEKKEPKILAQYSSKIRCFNEVLNYIKQQQKYL